MGINHNRKVNWTVVLIAVVLGFSAPAVADPLPAARFFGYLSDVGTVRLTKAGQITTQYSYWQQVNTPTSSLYPGYTGLFTASLDMWGGNQSGILVQGESDLFDLGATGRGEITYYFQAVPMDPELVSLSVPITIALNGEVSTSVSSQYGKDIGADVYAFYGSESSPFSILNAEATLQNSSDNESLSNTYYRYAPANSVRGVRIVADVYFVRTSVNTGSATAMIDPLIQIDPSWEYANQFYLEFSEGFGPEPSAVPEPATMLLLGSGLIGLAGYGRKKFFKK